MGMSQMRKPEGVKILIIRKKEHSWTKEFQLLKICVFGFVVYIILHFNPTNLFNKIHFVTFFMNAVELTNTGVPF